MQAMQSKHFHGAYITIPINYNRSTHNNRSTGGLINENCDNLAIYQKLLFIYFPFSAVKWN